MLYKYKYVPFPSSIIRHYDIQSGLSLMCNNKTHFAIEITDDDGEKKIHFHFVNKQTQQLMICCIERAPLFPYFDVFNTKRNAFHCNNNNKNPIREICSPLLIVLAVITASDLMLCVSLLSYYLS